MIAQVTGTVVRKETNWLIVDVHGVGYRVFVTTYTSNQLSKGALITLSTHMAVKQDALDLYGFMDDIELIMFEKLLTLPGVGPKSAMGILSTATVETLLHAITEEDPAYLTRMAGIGKKSAEKIVQGLKDKVEGIAPSRKSVGRQEEADIIEAIMALGYTMHEARDAVRELPETVVGVELRIKAALKALH